MGVRRLWVLGAACGLAILGLAVAIRAEDDRLIATVGKPAIVTATPAGAAQDSSGSAPRVVVHVTGYQPAQEGAVRGVVKVQKPDGSEQEIGTFGVFPNAAFKAETSRARSYSFDLPKELATGKVQLKVELVPDKAQGTGAGAQLEVERAEVR
jgi:hypothetical protein